MSARLEVADIFRRHNLATVESQMATFKDKTGTEWQIVAPVTAPADGIVGATLVEAGTAVEYGQELIRIELTPAPAESR